MVQRFFSMIPFPGSLSHSDYGNHRVVPAVSHPPISKPARVSRKIQNRLSGFYGFNPYKSSNVSFLAALPILVLMD